ncbi:MAG TPA: hypothetical protein VGL81_13380 [Polyangiaceae bacterium]|nr:hypothetical protein [Polyangiaceae bacterium]
MAFRRLLALHEHDVARMRGRFAARVSGYDAVQHSPTERLVTFAQGDRNLWTARAEPVARFDGDMGLLRWWWHGQKLGSARSRLDQIVAEGQRYGIEELTKDSVQTESIEHSDTVCALAAHLAGADGMLRLDDGGDSSFFVLYDATGSRITIPAPPISAGALTPAAHASRSLPPPEVRPAETRPAASSGPAEPPRELVSPVAVETMSVVQASLPGGFRQAMLTVMIDARGEKARLFVHVAASDMNGDLHALDASQNLFDAVVAMVSEQRRRGGADLQKLVLRVRPTDRGASIDVSVA